MRVAVAGQPYWLQIVEVVLVADLGLYFAHRMVHAIPLLWRFHQIHHSNEELDWLAAFRVHPVDQIATKGLALVPVFALGFSDAAIAVFALLSQWHAILLHSNISIGFGPLRWLIASPNFHHWHHSKEVAARDKNFAGQLSLLDVLFGTAHMPHGQVPSQYGIDDPLPSTYVTQLLHPFKGAGRPTQAAREEVNTITRCTIVPPKMDHNGMGDRGGQGRKRRSVVASARKTSRGAFDGAAFVWMGVIRGPRQGGSHGCGDTAGCSGAGAILPRSRND